ncbi:heat shock factor protein 2-like [Urocitellus parryii]
MVSGCLEYLIMTLLPNKDDPSPASYPVCSKFLCDRMHGRMAPAGLAGGQGRGLLRLRGGRSRGAAAAAASGSAAASGRRGGSTLPARRAAAVRHRARPLRAASRGPLNGQSFLVLDEQRFAKEILPKYFKHNNMASFVRQLNMYGFRKVVHTDSGIVKQERDGPVEFQHPYFKQGQDDLLENIKRKVSSSKPEEKKIRQEDLTKIISSAQKVQVKQETIESGLSELKSENESLWKEVSELRAKHAQQQQVIRKVLDSFEWSFVHGER